jgi:hypothetical protein
MFGRWQRAGHWARILTALQAVADVDGRIVWDVSADSTTVRAHQHAAGARKGGHLRAEPPGGTGAEPADHALGRSRGGWTTEVRLGCEQGQKPLSIVLTAGHRGDSPQFVPVIEGIPGAADRGGPTAGAAGRHGERGGVDADGGARRDHGEQRRRGDQAEQGGGRGCGLHRTVRCGQLAPAVDQPGQRGQVRHLVGDRADATRKGSVCAALITASSPGEACSTEYAGIGTAASAPPSALSVSSVQNSAKRRCPRTPSGTAKERCR